MYTYFEISKIIFVIDVRGSTCRVQTSLLHPDQRTIVVNHRALEKFLLMEDKMVLLLCPGIIQSEYPLAKLYIIKTSVAAIRGGLGDNCPPQFNKTRRLSVDVGNFEDGIETAMKKRVADEKQRVSILNEQTKCSRSVYSIVLSFYALAFLSKTRRKW